jgi:hypothetical protein
MSVFTTVLLGAIVTKLVDLARKFDPNDGLRSGFGSRCP